MWPAAPLHFVPSGKVTAACCRLRIPIMQAHGVSGLPSNNPRIRHPPSANVLFLLDNLTVIHDYTASCMSELTPRTLRISKFQLYRIF